MENLLTRARTVYKLPRGKGGWSVVSNSLVWRTETQLLGLARRHGDSESFFHRVTIDLPSGRTTEIGQTRFWRGWESVSPNGRWIAGIDFFAAEVRVSSVNGGKERVWRAKPVEGALRPRTLASFPLWLHGGESWVVLLSNTEEGRLWAVTGASNAPEKARTIDLGMASAATGGLATWGGIDGSDLLFSPDDDLIHGVNALGEGPLGKDDQLRRFSFRLSRGERSRIESVVPFVEGVSVRRVSYSSPARRMAILSTQGYGAAKTTVSLHTMRPNGWERVCLGNAEKVDAVDFLGLLQWLPSGKALSFWHNDELRVIDDAPPKPSQPAPPHARRLV